MVLIPDLLGNHFGFVLVDPRYRCDGQVIVVFGVPFVFVAVFRVAPVLLVALLDVP